VKKEVYITRSTYPKEIQLRQEDNPLFMMNTPTQHCPFADLIPLNLLHIDSFKSCQNHAVPIALTLQIAGFQLTFSKEAWRLSFVISKRLQYKTTADRMPVQSIIVQLK
jgi:hypothetical protein